MTQGRLHLPPNFRPTEVLAFHARDPERRAERVVGAQLEKALVVSGQPVVLRVALEGDAASYASDRPDTLRGEVLRHIVAGLLGLNADPGPFEARASQDPLLGPAVRQQRGLRIPQTATPFEAITWAITGQQITLGFAITLRRRLIEAVGLPASGDLIAYPEAAQVVKLTADELGAMQYSRAKADALLRVAAMVVDGELDFTALAKLPAEQALAKLVAIKGIGPWTAHYTQMRGLGMLDCSLHGDVAVRKAISRLRGDGVRVEQKEAERILAAYAPYRSLAAAHLWASLRTFSA
ncbi:MAG: DNA-3-methyladenine glycosylase 2 family protein [Burkholderiales bacterium]|nr:DNA-3-methyladenine glycosylase 2 family protein [Burkholderiales bacterium]